MEQQKRQPRGIRTLVIICTFILLLGSVTACSNAKNASDNQSDNGQAESTYQGGTEKSEPFKITIMADLHTPQVPEDTIINKIEELTNTELDIQWVPDGSYDEKMNSAIATGSLPQALFVKNQSSYIMLRDSLRNGQFWEIGPYIKDYKYLSNLKPVVLQNTAVDGKIYAIYQERPLSRWGLMYRKDWADKLGLDAPTTTDELFAMFKAFTEEDPDGNGSDDTIGVAVNSDLVYGGFKFVSSYFGTPNNWGIKDGKLLPEFMFPAYMDTMDFFKKMEEQGVVNLDFPVTSKKDQGNMLVNGKAGAIVGCLCNAAGFQQKVQAVNPDASLDVQNRIAGPNGEPGTWSNPGYGTVVLFPKSSIKTEAELKKILAFFDQLMSPKIYNLMKYGIEGTNYEIVDGMAKGFTDQEHKDLAARTLQPLTGLQIGGETTVDGLRRYPADPLAAKADQQVIDNNNILINDPTAPLDSKTNDEKGLQLQQIIQDATFKYILGEIDADGFQAAIDNWKERGGDAIISEFNAEYQKVQSK